MNKFISRGYDQAIHYINIDMPIYEHQLNLMNSELMAFISKSTGKWDKLMGKYYRSLTHDGYGSFVFIFDEDVLNLKSETQDKIITSLDEFFMNSNYYMTSGFVTMIEGIGSSEVSDIRMYIDSVLDLGFNIGHQDLLGLFSEAHGDSIVGQEYLLAKLKFPDRCDA